MEASLKACRVFITHQVGCQTIRLPKLLLKLRLSLPICLSLYDSAWRLNNFNQLRQKTVSIVVKSLQSVAYIFLKTVTVCQVFRWPIKLLIMFFLLSMRNTNVSYGFFVSVSVKDTICFYGDSCFDRPIAATLAVLRCIYTHIVIIFVGHYLFYTFILSALPKFVTIIFHFASLFNLIVCL